MTLLLGAWSIWNGCEVGESHVMLISLLGGVPDEGFSEVGRWSRGTRRRMEAESIGYDHTTRNAPGGGGPLGNSACCTLLLFTPPPLPHLLLALAAARCLCRASLVSFGSQTTRSCRSCITGDTLPRALEPTHTSMVGPVSLLCCSRGACGLAWPHRSLAIDATYFLACEEGCAHAKPL